MLAENMKTIILFIILLVSTSICAEVTLVKVDKSERKMYLLNGEKTVREFDISLGGSPKGHKEKEGDEKTPEGIYSLDYVKEDSSFYRAMHISYPNEIDKANAAKKGVDPGGFIMVHGQKNGLGWLYWASQNFNWTNGCIAITNREMDEFISLVKVGTKIQIEW